MKNTKILNQNTESVRYLCRKDKRLAKVISMVGEITYQTYTDSYAFLVKQIVFDEFPNMTDQEIIKKLTLIHGIGKWSAKMYLIFVLDRQDILPIEDVAFLQGYQWMYEIKDMKSENIDKRCKKWSPYSSIAARYLYQALDMGLTKKEN